MLLSWTKNPITFTCDSCLSGTKSKDPNELRDSHVIGYSVQNNSRIDVGVQNVTKVIV